jgi:hypothetical protein
VSSSEHLKVRFEVSDGSTVFGTLTNFIFEPVTVESRQQRKKKTAKINLSAILPLYFKIK